MSRLVSLMALFALLVPTAVACGGGPAPSTIAVELSEYRITGPNGAPLRVPPGRIVLAVSNAGRIVHDLAILQGDAMVTRTRYLQPGESQTITVTMRRGVTYDYFCTVHLHAALGMHVKVTPGVATGPAPGSP